MKRAPLYLLAIVLQMLSPSLRADSIVESGIEIDFNEGSLVVAGVPVEPPCDSAGRQVYLLSLSETAVRSVVGDHLLLRYRSKIGTPRELGLVIADFRSRPVRLSNLLPLPEVPTWDDNNYVRAEGNVLHFGVFMPKRMQYIYDDGKLAVDNGPWMGPAQPEVYSEPDKSLPCANVANVPECLAEVEREDAAKRAKQHRKPLIPAAKGSSSASAVH